MSECDQGFLQGGYYSLRTVRSWITQKCWKHNKANQHSQSLNIHAQMMLPVNMFDLYVYSLMFKFTEQTEILKQNKTKSKPHTEK